jgi:twinkle protein
MAISRLEQTAQQLDELSARRSIQKVPPVDFVKYMKERTEEHDNVKPINEYQEEILARLNGEGQNNGATMPWTSTFDKIKFRPAEVSMWQGYNGHKKSMTLGYISLGFIQQNEPVCIASFEMKPASTISRMLCQATGTIKPTPLAFGSFIDFCHNKLWMYDKQGTITPETLYGVIYYAAEKLGIKHFIIDSLMRVVGGEQDYDAQKDFVGKLCDIALETNIHIHFVHHNRKGDENQPAGRYGAKGSGSLSDNVHNALEVWQRPTKPSDNGDEPDMYIMCDKQREGEWEGAIGLWFDPNSLQMMGTKDGRTRTWTR